ncbi:MAG: tryptophan 7-halogenase [Emcibacter sp.]|nr:tryptophan 7-halogenase [Emcibacter sp.]
MDKVFKPIIIMGGGPAAVYTASGLVALGYNVTIIMRPRPFPAWEGLSERPLQSLRHFGFDNAVASVGPLVARKAYWNGKFQLQNQEYILNRTKFDQALLQDAIRKGVHVIQGRIEGVKRLKQGFRLSYVSEEQHHEIETDFLVEARGRESKLGRKSSVGQGDFVSAPATSALLKSYDVDKNLPAMTAVASFVRGWAWYLRDGEGTAIVQIFVSSEKGELPPKKDLNDYFLNLLKDLPEAEEWLSDAKAQDHKISVRTAAAQKSTPTGGDNFLVVGDGSLALDPLSGNGIFYAIGSGLAAVPVINTLLKKPENKKWALQFFQERVDFAFEGGCLMGKEFYASEERWPKAPFWQKRRHFPDSKKSSHPDPLSTPAEFCLKPVVCDGYIEPKKVIVTADHPRGVWQIDDVPLCDLLERREKGFYDIADNARFFGVDSIKIISAEKWLKARDII